MNIQMDIMCVCVCVFITITSGLKKFKLKKRIKKLNDYIDFENTMSLIQ